VVRPLILRMLGAAMEPLTPVAARATFAHKKKEGRREYLRVAARVVDDGTEVDKEVAEGAGLLTSITRSTGLVVLPPQVTRIEPGARVDYLPYASLVD
jgi:molybdopterin molybdotransferase